MGPLNNDQVVMKKRITEIYPLKKALRLSAKNTFLLTVTK